MQRLFLVFLITFLFSVTGKATHIAGADFNYQCVGQDSFLVTLNLFRDCTGVRAPASGSVYFESTCGSGFSVNLTLQNGRNGTEISQLCPGSMNSSTCNGGSLPGMQQYIYSDIVVLSPKCDTWTMTWDLCCRNTTVNLVGQPEMLVRATLNSATDSCNNSPVFNAQPILYVCKDQPVNYNFAVTEQDGDSIVYSFVKPLDKMVGGTARPVTFTPGYTFTQPIAGISLDVSTGQLNFTPTIQGNFVLAVEVCEYDYVTGALLGCIVRDIQFVVIQCSNFTPEGPPTGISSFTGTGALIAPDSVEVCIGNSFSFSMVFTDSNALDTVTLTTNIQQVLPGTIVNITNGNPATLTVSGIATANLPALSTFTVNAIDNACPIPASTTEAYNIITNQIPIADAGGSLLGCKADAPFTIQGVVTNADGGIWSGGLGTFSMATTNLNNGYIPTQAELNAGSVDLYLATSGSGNCASVMDTLTLNFTEFNANITPSSTDVICNGESNGAATINLTGGTSPFTSTWNTSPVQNGLTATNLAAGSYQVLLTDGNGCDSTANVQVVEPTVLTANLVVLSNVFCKGGNTGSAEAVPSGGIAPYTYVWDANAMNQTTAISTQLSAGNYSVSITDANGCLIVEIVTITEPNSPLSLNVITNDISCYGLADGNSTANPSGGTAPYNYTWSVGGQTTSSVSNLALGSYSVTVVDQSGFCITQTGIIINEPAALSSTDTSKHVSCFSGNDGQAEIIVSGGTVPYTYQWDVAASNQTTSFASNLTSGNYQVSVTDLNGCMYDTIVNVIEPTLLQVVATSSDVLCFNGADGMATVIATGGAAPYTYLWDANANNQTSDTASLLALGSYTVSVTDTNSCMQNTTVVVNQPSLLVVTDTVVSHVFCKGGNSGVAAVNVTGGVPPYSYLWDANALNQTNDTATQLSAGTYSVTVTDAGGCTKTELVTITEPNSPLTLNVTTTDITCFGFADGTSSTITAGGTAPYSYTWSVAGQTSSQVSGLDQGVYSVTVLDQSGFCIAQSGIIVNEPAKLSSMDSIIDVTCFGGSNGSASISASGGVSPYLYQWDVNANNQTSTIANNLAVGLYNVSITDFNGCVFDTSVVVSSPQPIQTTFDSDTTRCFGDNNGSATVFAFGGIGPYTYAWDANANSQTDSIAINLTSGNYQITVTDSNGCVFDTNVSVFQPDDLTVSSIGYTHVGCHGDANGQASVFVIGGSAPYTYQWDAFANLQSTAMANSLAIGNYSVTISDTNGCNLDTVVTVTQPFAPLNLSAIITDVSCFGDSTGSITINPNGGTLPYSFQWTANAGNSTTNMAQNLLTGTYSILVSDSNGCQRDTSIFINQPTAPLALTSITINPLCYGDSNGSIQITPSGGTLPFTFQWDSVPGNQTISHIQNLKDGIYGLTLSDVNGCDIDTSFIVQEPQPLAFGSVITDEVKCKGGNDGSASVLLTGGTTPYNYLWDVNAGYQTNPTAYSLSQGSYTISITDLNGCLLDSVVLINEPTDSLRLVTVVTPVNCYNGNDGYATATVNGGTNPYTVDWGVNSGNQTGLSATNLSSGTYQVIATDSNGCLDTNQVVVTQPNAPISLNTSSFPVSCNNFSDGSVSVQMLGGTAPCTYQWGVLTGSQTTQLASNLIAGTYEVTITDNNGCMDSTQVQLTEPLPISIYVSPDDTVCTEANFNVSVNANGGNGTYTYLWNNGLTSRNLHTVKTKNSNVYTVSVTDQNNCPGVLDSIQITINNIYRDSLNSWATNDVCLGDTSTLFAKYSGGSGVYTYQWSHGLGTGSGPKLVTPVAATIYEVTVTDECDSKVSDFVVVNMLQAPVISTPAIIEEGCGPLTVTFTDNVTNTGNPTYFWDFGDGNTSTDISPTHTYTAPGTYKITIEKTTSLGCTSISNGNSVVQVFPFPHAEGVADKYVAKLSSARINFTDISTGGTSLRWDFEPNQSSNLPNPVYTFTDTGSYDVILSVLNSYGCSSNYTLNILVETENTFDTPNAFTPNSDGGNGGYYDPNSLSNEVFFPRMELVAEYHLMIFNRWGELIFESTDINIGWDGYYRGELSAQDAYVWKIEATFLDGTTLNKVGDLTLLR